MQENAIIEMPPKADVIQISNSPLDMPVEAFSKALNRREENRKALLAWIAGNLVKGVDFGSVHIMSKDKCPKGSQCKNPYHWSKPSLWKAGAEKICGMLGLIPRFPNHAEYERAAYSGTEIKQVVLKCQLETPSGFVAAEGIGARSLAKDRGDLNKCLKMAQKSAHVDACLRVAGLSEIFTQDLEDMRLGDPEKAVTITEGQRRRLEARIKDLSLDRDRVKAWVLKRWGIEHFADLTADRYETLDKKLAGFAEIQQAETE